MNGNLDELKTQALQQLDSIWDNAALEAWRIAYLGRKGAVSALFEQIGTLPKEERGEFGKRANEVKTALESAFQARTGAIKQRALSEALEAEPFDVTLPGRRPERGRIHPTIQTLREIYKIFGEMGFQVYRTRQVETDLMNFQLLNIPPFHPARDNWSTFYVAGTDDKVLLRTHTSPGQIRVMPASYTNPSRVILPGIC